MSGVGKFYFFIFGLIMKQNIHRMECRVNTGMKSSTRRQNLEAPRRCIGPMGACGFDFYPVILRSSAITARFSPPSKTVAPMQAGQP
jgi:hypothetical protein